MVLVSHVCISRDEIAIESTSQQVSTPTPLLLNPIPVRIANPLPALAQYATAMKKLLLSLLVATKSSIACQREFPDEHFSSQFARSSDTLTARAEPFPPVWTKNEAILHRAFDSVELETWASYYTHGDHIAGRNKSMAEETAKKWNANGVPSSLVEYEVYLNYPESQKLVLNRANGSKYEAQLWEDKIAEDETTEYPGSIPAFHGYSASGDVEAEYVYVG